MTGPPSISAALADSIYRSAVLMQREGRYAEAEAEYVRLLPYFPDSAALHYNIGLLLYAQDRFEASLEHYLQAMDEAGISAEVLGISDDPASSQTTIRWMSLSPPFALWSIRTVRTVLSLSSI